MSIQIKLKNSVVQDSTPSTSDLPVVGELALNANINSIGGFMRASDNSIVKIFGPGSVTTPTATTTVSGIAELATNTETTTGTATNRVVTPAGLNAVTVAERATSNTNYVAKAGSTLTGALTMPNGSNSAPAINFGDSDSGIFGGTNTVSLAAGGTTRLTANTGVDVTGNLSVSGLITGTGNLVIADNIIHSGDTDTSVGFPAANTVNIQTDGTERARVDSSGRLLIGTSTAQTNRIDANTFDPLLQITSNIEAAASITRFSNTTNPGRFSLQKSRGTIASPVIVQDNDVLGEVLFSGWDGDTFTNGAKIIAAVDGTPGDDDMPSRLVFSTTADGAASSTTRLTIDSAGTSTFAGNITTTGNLTISNTEPQIFLTDTNNNSDFKIRVQNGVFLIEDTTNNNADRFQIGSSGVVDIFGNLNVGAGIDVTGAITATGNLSITNVAPKIFLTDSDTDSDFSIRNMHGVFGIHDQTNSADRLTVASDGTVNVAGNLDVGAGVDITGNITGTGDLTIDSGILHVDSTNNRVGINTTTPAGLLDLRDTSGASITVRNTGTVASIGLAVGTATNQVVSRGANTSTARPLVAMLGNTERVRVDNSGRVGIGTSNPNSTTLLHVSAPQTGSAGGTGITLSGWNGSAESRVQLMSYGIGNGTLAIRNTTSNTEVLRIDDSGNVGIGTTSPNYNLVVQGTGAQAMLVGSTNAASAAILIDGDSNGDGAGADYASITHTATGALEINNRKSASIIFKNTSSETERMGIDANGNVRVGDSSINIAGVGAGPTFAVNGAAPEITLRDSATGNPYAWIATDDNGSLNLAADQGNNANNSVIKFRVDGSERMLIDSSGNVGIGTTSPSVKLDVTGSFKVSGLAEFANTINLTHASAGSNIIYFNDDLQFAKNGTGTRLKIDSAGNVGIQNTNPGSFHSSGQDLVVGSGVGEEGMTIFSGNGSNGVINFADGTSGNESYQGRIVYSHDVNRMTFHVSDGTERMRITSGGNLGIGLTAIAGRVHAHSAANTATFVADGEVDNPQYPSYGFAGQNADNGSRGAGMYLPGDNTLAFATAGNERVRISGDGFVSIGNTSAQGSRLFIDSSGVDQNTLRLKQSQASALIQFNEVTNTSYVGDGYKFHGSRSAGSNYNFMAFDSAHASTPDREFTIRGDGNAFADGTWNNNGADYAEFFESSTGSAIPVGTAVVLDNNKVRAATSSDAVGNIIGVVRPKEPGQASMTIGNTAWNKWQGKYLTDDFDRFILDEHNVINWTDADGTFHSYESHAIPSGVTVPSDAQTLTEDVNGNKFTHYRLNPDYDSSKTYVPRSDRDEWVIVGLVGQVKVLKGQAVNDRWVKMKDVSDTVEEYFIR